MKRIVMAMGMVAVMVGCHSAIAQAQVTVYRDADQNIYFDGVVASQLYRVGYIPDPNRRDRRYQSGWMYQTTDQFSCTVHHLWHTRRFPLFGGNLTIFNTLTGDVDIPALGNELSYTAIENPCSGATINTALPWLEIAPGVKAIRSTNSCRFNYVSNGETNCVALPVIYIAGLPNPAYKVATASAEVRMTKSNACGFLKIANTQKWQAFPKDKFSLQTYYRADHPNYHYYGTFNRGTMPYRADNQIPRCFSGLRYLPAPN